jgi:hypothetical protein
LIFGALGTISALRMVPRTQAPASPDFPAITDPGRPAPMIVGLGLSASVASMPILQAKRAGARSFHVERLWRDNIIAG